VHGRSILTYPDAQRLLDRGAGTGQPVNDLTPGAPGFKERVDFGEEIGIHVDTFGRMTPTSKGIIIYDASGRAHIVPARP
jgi:filamentous hemagglutinin